jgi:hypothetical protein
MRSIARGTKLKGDVALKVLLTLSPGTPPGWFASVEGSGGWASFRP